MELILTVSIISIIALLSASFYSRFILQNAVNNTVDQLAGSLRKAQIYSMTGRYDSSWGVHAGNSTLTLFKGTTYASRDSAFDETFSLNPNVTIANFTEVSFTKITGIPSAAPTVTITGNNTTKIIQINSYGIVSKS